MEHCSPRDVPKAAADFPDLNFLIYHAGFKSASRTRLPAAQDDFKTTTERPVGLGSVRGAQEESRR